MPWKQCVGGQPALDKVLFDVGQLLHGVFESNPPRIAALFLGLLIVRGPGTLPDPVVDPFLIARGEVKLRRQLVATVVVLRALLVGPTTIRIHGQRSPKLIHDLASGPPVIVFRVPVGDPGPQRGGLGYVGPKFQHARFSREVVLPHPVQQLVVPGEATRRERLSSVRQCGDRVPLGRGGRGALSILCHFLHRRVRVGRVPA